MAKEVRLPQLGQTMEEGTIVGFSVKIDGEVKKGDVIFEVETDKATLEVESPAEGFVKHILVEVGQTVPVGEPILVLGDKAQSKREIPCYYLNVRADFTELVELRAKMNETGDAKVSYNDFIIRAVATGVEKFPIMSGQLAGDAIKLADAINVGLAVSAPKGLIVPVVKDANKKDVKQIAAETQALIEKARNEKLQLSDLEGACITVSNLGGFGVESFIPIVIPGQCSILGIGRIADTCVPDNGNIAIRKLISLTLSVDHKVANGAYAGQFLDFVRKQLEDTSAFV